MHRPIPNNGQSSCRNWRKTMLQLERLIYGPKRDGTLYERLLEGPALHYDFTWFRPIGPGRGTAPHCDLVYMGRGTQQVFTMWVPYGDVPLRLGGLMVLEGSHRKSALLRNYLSRDVDSYCVNRPGAEEAKNSDSLALGWQACQGSGQFKKETGRTLVNSRVCGGRYGHLLGDPGPCKSRQPNGPDPSIF